MEAMDMAEDMDKLEVDFEAYPPHESDLGGLVNLATQIFLQADVDCEGIAKKIIEYSPLGCVFKPAEEFEDDAEGPEGLVYGALSIVNLIGNEKFQADISDFLLGKAKKYATQDTLKKLEKLLRNASEGLGLVINERMLQFPDDMCAPAFRSLREDLSSMRFKNVLIIVKVRAAKKVETDVIFDNSEESMLFKAVDPVFFQYPAYLDVDKTSKFHSTIINGTTYLSYRRVCLLSMKQFLEFVEIVVKRYSVR